MEAKMEELDFSKVVTEDLIQLDMLAATKMEVIEELTHLLFVNGCIEDEDTFVKDVMYRENEGVTGLEKGIAIPHGKSDAVLKTSIAIGRTKKPVEWESMDGNPINIIILFAVKNADKTTTHIKLLQKVAVLLADEETIEQFQTLQTKKDFLQLLSKNN
ncbi:PTS sugar transporter subunit IIA [Niallia sp. NCCP-28]|uniref:PTS sugar transporter subunit IIA n=1 Tax=Niallia sp. NCCP-28 TaxID=2934712 RepID=UPI0020801F7B|nr:PTS sugar transporter subunit IIA [Niallia sp. NCCP-28]GKU82079.1 PTS fructose transporter subunit IIA [Niallia sp. NCCP-28]